MNHDNLLPWKEVCVVAINTGWASQVTARDVDWPCPAPFYVFRCNF